MKNNQNQVADTDLVHNLIEETIAGSLTNCIKSLALSKNNLDQIAYHSLELQIFGGQAYSLLQR